MEKIPMQRTNAKKFTSLLLLGAIISLFIACKKDSTPTVPNKEKPVIFFNVQPADPKTGNVDLNVMKWNDKTYFLGTDSLKIGFVQGKMITDYLAKADPAKLDRNGDGIIGYVLCIGDSGHKDSRGRTEAVRKSLGTWDNSFDTKKVKEGKAIVGGKEYKVVELDSKIMIGPDGTMWNADSATEAMSNWVTKLDTQIDMVISNNDQMAMGCLQVSNYPAGVPIFGFDAVADALEAINSGKLTGTVSQNADAQMAAIMQILRNILDGLPSNEILESGFTKPDQYGNQIPVSIDYNPETKAITLNGIAITKENCQDFIAEKRFESIKQTQAPAKKIFFSTYNETDLFMTTKVRPAALYYAPLYNLQLSVFGGDGQNESSLLDKFTNLNKYDAYVIGIIRQNSAHDYLDKLKY